MNLAALVLLAAVGAGAYLLGRRAARPPLAEGIDSGAARWPMLALGALAAVALFAWLTPGPLFGPSGPSGDPPQGPGHRSFLNQLSSGFGIFDSAKGPPAR